MLWDFAVDLPEVPTCICTWEAQVSGTVSSLERGYFKPITSSLQVPRRMVTLFECAIARRTPAIMTNATRKVVNPDLTNGTGLEGDQWSFDIWLGRADRVIASQQAARRNGCTLGLILRVNNVHRGLLDCQVKHRKVITRRDKLIMIGRVMAIFFV